MNKYDVTAAGGDTATPLNLQKRLKLVRDYITPGKSRLLDCGCGRGDYVVTLRSRFKVDAWGIEYLEDKVDAFRRAYPGLDWVSQGDIEDIDYPDDHFDVVLLNEVLEHVPRDEKALREVYRVLRPKGNVILFSPNRLFPFETHGVYWRNSGERIPPYVPLIPYVPVYLGRKVFTYWARNYWPKELRGLVERAGFSMVHISYLWQTFENISGSQPAVLRVLSPFLRKVANALEVTPLLRSFGVSQVIIAQKPGHSARGSS